MVVTYRREVLHSSKCLLSKCHREVQVLGSLHLRSQRQVLVAAKYLVTMSSSLVLVSPLNMGAKLWVLDRVLAMAVLHRAEGRLLTMVFNHPVGDKELAESIFPAEEEILMVSKAQVNSKQTEGKHRVKAQYQA